MPPCYNERGLALDTIPMEWVGGEDAREEGRGEGQEYQGNFRVLTTEIANSIELIRPYLGPYPAGGPVWA